MWPSVSDHPRDPGSLQHVASKAPWKWKEHGGPHVGGFYGSGLEAVHTTYAYFPMAGTQPHGHTPLLRRLGSVVYPCTRKEEEMRL